MVNATCSELPRQDAISEHKLKTLPFTFELTVYFVQHLKTLERITSWFFVGDPFNALLLPLVESNNSFWIVLESDNNGLSLSVGFIT
ncbi:MAG: hypothetical protein A3I71_00585 [Omnitrophica WOR_2 bacterium RIFCSPLOWO2_02_FULL_63_16]|nr:MAG: hypothetical protein A3I71_00585 [Omnitrophica WOR_2 bacterium RIFCSPLOWO2_02_FULL_63_16]